MQASKSNPNRRWLESAGSLGKGDVCTQPRVVYDLKFLFLAVTLTGIWTATTRFLSISGVILLAIYMLTYLFGCWKTRRATLFVLPALYIPIFAAILLTGQIKSAIVQVALESPGFLFAAIFAPMDWPTSRIILVLSTLAIFFSAVMAARPSKRHATVISCLVLLACCLVLLVAS